MKKAFYFLPTLLLTLSLASPVSAQNTNTQMHSGQNMGESQRQSSFEELGIRIHDRYQNHLRLYEQFFTKLENRRSLLASEGTDTDNLDRLVRVAKNQFGTTRGQVDSFSSFLKGQDYSGGPATLRNQIRGQMTQVRTEFTRLHTAVRQIVADIANLSN